MKTITIKLTQKDIDELNGILDCSIVGLKEYVEEGYADQDDKKRLNHQKRLFKKIVGFDWHE